MIIDNIDLVFTSSSLFDGYSFEVWNPGRFDDFTSLGQFLVTAWFGLWFHPSFWLNLGGMIPQTVNYGALRVKVIETLFHFRCLREISFGLKMILQFMDDWTGWAQVTIVSFRFGCLFKCTFWLQMILKWSNDMCTGGRLSLVVGFRLSLWWNWSCRKTERRGSSKVWTRLTSVAEKLHFWSTIVNLSWWIKERSWTSSVDGSVTSNGSSNGWGVVSFGLRRHCCCTCVYFFFFQRSRRIVEDRRSVISLTGSWFTLLIDF